MNKRISLFLALAWAAAATAAHAQDGAHAGAAPPVARVARAAESPRVDGRLDDAAWAAATPVTAFTQVDPDQGQPVSEATEIRLVYDEEALYVGARFHDRGRISARLGRRDMDLGDSDWLGVVIDSYHGHQSAFSFDVNPAGVRRDAIITDAGNDMSWDAVWQAETTRDSAGWTAEYRIPFSQLRFNPRETTWGVQLERIIGRRNEYAVFSFTPKDQPGGIARFGHLEGLQGVRTGKRLEILPYTVARAEYVDPAGNPFRTDGERSVQAGVDLKYRVTSDLTLDVAVNPDFGQVELDPAVVNLTAFETVFEEKRPFFVEGSDIFNFANAATPMGQIFYSRRIGGRVSPLSPNADLYDLPRETRILGAAKLTGQTANGWSVGILNALTDRAEARFLDEEGNADRLVVEPFTNYFVGRLRKDMRGGQTYLGGMVTAVNRDLESEELEGVLLSSAYSAGVDFRHEFLKRAWVLSGYLSGSTVAGDSLALLRTQVRPYHYFQRPDATHLDVDTDATTLSGLSGQVRLARRAGLHWRGSMGVATVSPGYEVGELGTQRRGDRVDVDGVLQYLEQRPGKHLRFWNVQLTSRAEWNYDFDHIYNSAVVSLNAQNLSYWGLTAQFGMTLPASDDRLTRGGPMAARPGNRRGYLALSSDQRRPVTGNLGFYGERHDYGGWFYYMDPTLTVKTSPRWNLTLGPYFDRNFTPAQYITRVTDAGATRTFGSRYVFADLTTSTLSLDVRFNYTFSPELTLEVYAEPYVTAGRFGAYKEFTTPGEFDFDVYGRDIGTVTPAQGGGFRIDPDADAATANSFTVGQFFGQDDFNIRALRGNAVLRWEWRPGSTLFLVWQQERNSFTGDVGGIRFGRDREALFRTQPDNVFVVKVNYWLNP